ncbi:hypothetical protein DesLBE_4617 [Desulfitobacterium sp. LBE]|uniref:hypothetical protein n=1 Tax=Desulfitobacterium sp. LBE TaxID=884086 RepID=UPI001199F39C|nr:hypothetical protein [Desulfitobacterium sp. LBE]TWH60197.1 hypothetical protein DesLBE_4617 [Desulfitobacterium sp. LBE]
MGYDSNNHLSTGINTKEVKEFLIILGYKQISGNIYYFFKDDNYKYLNGVRAEIIEKEDGRLIVWTRTNIWCTKHDLDFQNFTIKQIRKRFGGNFATDNGTNRYFVPDQPNRVNAEAGCYLAHERLDNDFVTARLYLEMVKQSEDRFKSIPVEYLRKEHPLVVATNMLLPFLVSIIEDYFRNTYVALLKYSERKSNIFKNFRPHPDDLLKVSSSEISIEEAVARTMSFQNINKICSYFKELDPRLDISGTLRKPYRRRKESLFQTLDRILEHRHGIIHWREMIVSYDLKSAYKDIDSIRVALDQVYEYLVNTYEWN